LDYSSLWFGWLQLPCPTLLVFGIHFVLVWVHTHTPHTHTHLHTGLVWFTTHTHTRTHTHCCYLTCPHPLWFGSHTLDTHTYTRSLWLPQFHCTTPTWFTHLCSSGLPYGLGLRFTHCQFPLTHSLVYTPGLGLHFHIPSSGLRFGLFTFTVLVWFALPLVSSVGLVLLHTPGFTAHTHHTTTLHTHTTHTLLVWLVLCTTHPWFGWTHRYLHRLAITVLRLARQRHVCAPYPTLTTLDASALLASTPTTVTTASNFILDVYCCQHQWRRVRTL